MTIEDFIKPGKTYVVITIDNNIWVDCYKTSKIKITDEEGYKALEIYEDDIHSDYIKLSDVENYNFYIKWKVWADIHTREVLIYDATSFESLRAANDILQKISDNFADMQRTVESFKNFVYYDLVDKNRKEN